MMTQARPSSDCHSAYFLGHGCQTEPMFGSANKRLKTSHSLGLIDDMDWFLSTTEIVTTDPSIDHGLAHTEPELPLPTRKALMKTGCVNCLIKGVACNPANPDCRIAISDEWSVNDNEQDVSKTGLAATPFAHTLSVMRPDTKWRRTWRERHSLNFFVDFSAPQMAGFFDSSFWQRMVIQASFHEPAILHAVTAIGALHEAVMQRAFAGDNQKVQAMEFALAQCNCAISELTHATSSHPTTNSRLDLTTCVLFTCFEAMQGHCDSAVGHALQGRRLLQAIDRSNATTLSSSEAHDIEQMRPLVERLEVQATALLDQDKRPAVDASDQSVLPSIDYIFSLDHAHSTLHNAINSIMRFMQCFRPANRNFLAIAMAEKYLRYVPWFQQWETAFAVYLSAARPTMSQLDLKRAMVLKANYLVGTMLACVDQSGGPAEYEAYEAEFEAIVELSREVLATYTSPPLPTLSGGNIHAGTPYLSFSLWVTDSLGMVISRCRNPSIRQAAFTLLSQNPRQEGIWHAGPLLSNKHTRRSEAATGGRHSHSSIDFCRG